MRSTQKDKQVGTKSHWIYSYVKDFFFSFTRITLKSFKAFMYYYQYLHFKFDSGCCGIGLDLGQEEVQLVGCQTKEGFPGGLVVKNPPTDADVGQIPGSGRPLEKGNSNPLQCSYLGNPMDRGAWRATVHGVTRSRTCLNKWACRQISQEAVTVFQEENNRS